MRETTRELPERGLVYDELTEHQRRGQPRVHCSLECRDVVDCGKPPPFTHKRLSDLFLDKDIPETIASVMKKRKPAFRPMNARKADTKL